MRWRFDAPLDHVWLRLTDPRTFPGWWPGFESARVDGTGEVGTLPYFRVRGDFGLRFDLVTRIEEVRHPEYLRLASAGGLAGTRVWRLAHEDGATSVTYVWDVEPTNRLLRLLSRIPPIRRRMVRSHDGVMEAGGRNLARLLESDAGNPELLLTRK